MSNDITINNFPREIISLCFQNIDYRSVHRLKRICKLWKQIIDECFPPLEREIRELVGISYKKYLSNIFLLKNPIHPDGNLVCNKGTINPSTFKLKKTTDKFNEISDFDGPIFIKRGSKLYIQSIANDIDYFFKNEKIKKLTLEKNDISIPFAENNQIFTIFERGIINLENFTRVSGFFTKWSVTTSVKDLKQMYAEKTQGFSKITFAKKISNQYLFIAAEFKVNNEKAINTYLHDIKTLDIVAEGPKGTLSDKFLFYQDQIFGYEIKDNYCFLFCSQIKNEKIHENWKILKELENKQFILEAVNETYLMCKIMDFYNAKEGKEPVSLLLFDIKTGKLCFKTSLNNSGFNDIQFSGLYKNYLFCQSNNESIDIYNIPFKALIKSIHLSKYFPEKFEINNYYLFDVKFINGKLYVTFALKTTDYDTIDEKHINLMLQIE